MRTTKTLRKLNKIKRILAHSARKEKRMKKYRLTKITVKTREIISMSKTAAGENENSVCPVCHAPLSAFLPAAEHSNDAACIDERTDELPTAKLIS
jgi:hypothetical protein